MEKIIYVGSEVTWMGKEPLPDMICYDEYTPMSDLHAPTSNEIHNSYRNHVLRMTGGRRRRK